MSTLTIGKIILLDCQLSESLFQFQNCITEKLFLCCDLDVINVNGHQAIKFPNKVEKKFRIH